MPKLSHRGISSYPYVEDESGMRGRRATTYWASSQVTMFDKPILYIRVKNDMAVKIKGAIMNSYSSSVDKIDDRGCSKSGCQNCLNR